MKSLLYAAASLFFIVNLANAKNLTKQEQESSQKIAKAVEMMSVLAQSGVQEYEVTPSKNIKQFMFELAKESYLSGGDAAEEFETLWVGSAEEAWEPDSTNWGEATFGDAYNYVIKSGDQDGIKKTDIEKAKEAFNLLKNTGVLFGVAPLGAVQCGVTFAALVIIDPYTGKLYVFSKEGSGC